MRQLQHERSEPPVIVENAQLQKLRPNFQQRAQITPDGTKSENNKNIDRVCRSSIETPRQLPKSSEIDFKVPIPLFYKSKKKNDLYWINYREHLKTKLSQL